MVRGGRAVIVAWRGGRGIEGIMSASAKTRLISVVPRFYAGDSSRSLVAIGEETGNPVHRQH